MKFPQTIQFVYFDLDDTLLDHRRAERLALADLCAAYADQFGHLPVERVQATYHDHNVVLWGQYAEGRIGKDELKRLRFERLLAALAIEGLNAPALNAYYLAHYARHWHFDAAARQAFEAVAARYPVGVLTNGFTEVQQQKLERFPEIRDKLQALVISEEVGYLKPHPKLFAHATEAAGVPPGAILYVGDSYRSDVQGARRAGWQSAWYTTAGEAEDGVFCFNQWAALTQHLL